MSFHTDHPDFFLRLNADPFSFEVHSSSPFQPQHLPSPPARPLSHHRTAFEDIPEYFHETHDLLTYTRQCEAYRTTYRPRFSPSLPPPHSITTVTAHIHTPIPLCVLSRTRTLTVCGRERVKDVVRQLLGRSTCSDCTVYVKKRGTWRYTEMEARIGDSGQEEVELRIERSDDGGRSRRLIERERVVVEVERLM